MKSRGIPSYFVYGEPDRALDVGFFHVEQISQRFQVHHGNVAAHKHPQLAQITFWLNGNGTYRIEDKSWTFSAPAVSFVPSGVVHGFSVSMGTDAIVLSVTDDALHSIFSRNQGVGNFTSFVQKIIGGPDWDNLELLMKMMKQELEMQQKFSESAMLHLLGHALSLISRLNSASENVQSNHVQTLAERLRTLVEAHYRDNWAIGRYVNALASTQYLVEKAANICFDKSVKQLVLQRKMLEAKRLLKFTIRTSEDVAAELGFKDPAYFSRDFKKHTTMAPGMWRRENRNK